MNPVKGAQFTLIAVTLFLALAACSQQRHTGFGEDLIKEKDVRETENFLASDALKGRRTFSPEIQQASNYIERRFNAAGLKPYAGDSYRQEFFLYQTQVISCALEFNGVQIPDSAFYLSSPKEKLEVSDVHFFRILRTDSLASRQEKVALILSLLRSAPSSNVMLVVDPTLRGLVKRLRKNTWMTTDPPRYTLLLVESASIPVKIHLSATDEVSKKALNNVAGVLPGIGRPAEFVIFSAHYDHLGIGPNAQAIVQPSPGKDSIYNGANDDASGTTAVIELADYYARRHDNQRSILFVAFTAEEIGEYGSQYFSGLQKPETIVCMFNIEMIGTQSKWGENSAYITGYERSDFGKLLKHNLKSSPFKFFPDPYPEQNLFYRSDNAQLARKGVPAHTVSTSKMDSEVNYHTVADEVKTLDLADMTRIIRAIAISSAPMVSGQQTPSRISPQAGQ